MIGADQIAVYTDIKKKHSSHALTSDLSLSETAKKAGYFLSDGVIITGTSTGKVVLVDDVKSARTAISIPVLIGSGITNENLKNYWNHADAFIVGSSLKVDGDWRNSVDLYRVKRLMNEVKRLRGE